MAIFVILGVTKTTYSKTISESIHYRMRPPSGLRTTNGFSVRKSSAPPQGRQLANKGRDCS